MYGVLQLVFVFNTVYCVLQVFDPGLVLYLYESPAGYGIIALRLIGWLWFSYATFFTLKHYPEKSLFYYPFYIYYTIWYVQLRTYIIHLCSQFNCKEVH